MKRPAPLLTLFLVLLLNGGCEEPPPPPVDQSARPAKLFRVTAQPNAARHELVGRVEAAQTIDVSFQVSGELWELPIRQGQTLRAGELVAALDPLGFNLAAQEAAVQRRLAEQDLARKDALLRDRSIAQAAADDARAQFDLSEIRLAQARKRQADARILAPFDAVVTRRYVDNRTRVRDGEPIARLMDLNALKVVVSVSEALMATVLLNGRLPDATARFDFLPEATFPLRYLDHVGEANPVAQTFDVTFGMTRPQGLNILPGMTAAVRLERDNHPVNGFTIPASALVSDAEGRFFVWVYDPATAAITRRPVRPGAPLPQGITIEQGLVDGDLIVAAGATQLRPGMRVQPRTGAGS
jgi:RND family efflux transporter MFP subunit